MQLSTFVKKQFILRSHYPVDSSRKLAGDTVSILKIIHRHNQLKDNLNYIYVPPFHPSNRYSKYSNIYNATYLGYLKLTRIFDCLTLVRRSAVFVIVLVYTTKEFSIFVCSTQPGNRMLVYLHYRISDTCINLCVMFFF